MHKNNIFIIFICGILYILNKNIIFQNDFISIFIKCYFNDVLCGLFWEIVTPIYVNYSVGDPIDIIAYMFGGFVYWAIMFNDKKYEYNNK